MFFFHSNIALGDLEIPPRGQEYYPPRYYQNRVSEYKNCNFNISILSYHLSKSTFFTDPPERQRQMHDED